VVFFCTCLSGGCEKRERPEQQHADFWGVGVKVINGTGINRLAWIVAWEMTSRGFNVYGTGDTSENFDCTVVVDLRDSSGRNAHAVAQGLKMKKRTGRLPIKKVLLPKVEVKIDSSRFVDVLVILGDDYRIFFPTVAPVY
jgi:hypothetical protein